MNILSRVSVSGRMALSGRLIAVLLAVCLFGIAGALAEDGWVCPNCGRENIAEANFCGSCRTARPQDSLTIQNPGVNAWVCSSCGKIVSSDDAFCINCGQDHLETDTPAIMRPARSPKEVVFEPASMIRIPAYAEKGTLTYQYTASVSGVYLFSVEDNAASMEFKMKVKDRLDKIIRSEDFYTRNSSLRVNCTQGETYTIEVLNNNAAGYYTFCIGEAKDVQPAGEYSVIHDSFSFTYQNNRYVIVPQVTGKYRVELAEAQQGFEVNACIKDALGYTLTSSSFGMRMGHGISTMLTAGETYYIEIEQRSSLGDYILAIGCPNPTIDISGCSAFSDTVDYTGQINEYRFTAAETRTYSFTLSQTKQGNEFNVSMNDSLGYRIRNYTGMREGWSLDVDLTAGETYQVIIEQRDGFGSYSFVIGSP